MRSDARIDTKLVHAGEPEPRIEGAVAMPVFQSVLYEDEGVVEYHDIRYIRLNNTPNHTALHAKLAALENAEAALVTGSGMAAITTSLLSILSAGDHLLVQDNLYGGTHDFVTQDLPAYGISFDFIDADDAASWPGLLRRNTKAVYVEAMTNPLLQVGDLAAVPHFAREHGLVSLIDSTFASPVNFRPPEHGFDLSLHSATKYLNGHSDIVAGAVIGRAELVEKVRHKLNHLGGSLDPHACFLLHRGLKTLALRMRFQNESTLAIARFLESAPGVSRVSYPGLASHPRHDRARALFSGFGGVVSFELAGGDAAAARLIERTALPRRTVSLGGVETLITRPALTSHSGMAPEDRQRLGISDSLIRLAVGIEATEDLMADLDQALRA
ncbi:MAG TPA: aminotransferase class I/II-fold pyridoxal phosphate-dependent enzyme [Thermoanaerobaculia bacterium]|jgi:cystathionine beta-lyase/cystathionine gamma-synthase|nr:aminotransferase class I/II-fold pyridoxal phosphate-dependent enzyme [Thermoanaerobaculia bacterium]